MTQKYFRLNISGLLSEELRAHRMDTGLFSG